MNRPLVCSLVLGGLLSTSMAQAQAVPRPGGTQPAVPSSQARGKLPPAAATRPAPAAKPAPAEPVLSAGTPELDGIQPGGVATTPSGQTLPNEDWLVKPVAKPKVGVYHSCQLYVPQDAEQARRVAQAEPVARFRNPHDAGAQPPEQPEPRSYLWCREAAGERGVDLLANHDDTVSRTLSHTLQAHRLLEQTISLDLTIGQARAALSEDLKQQVAGVRADVRKEVVANVSQRNWTIAGWWLAGAFFLTTTALTTVVVLK